MYSLEALFFLTTFSGEHLKPPGQDTHFQQRLQTDFLHFRLRTPLRQLPSLILEACYYALTLSDFNSDCCNELFTLITCRVGGGRRIEGKLTLPYFVVNKDGFVTCFGCNVAPRGSI
jgi:hypothetical protein